MDIGDWPKNGLERLEACPLCGEEKRTLLHEGLVDSIFFVAPGKWTMWRCAGCRSGYLDPRPDERTIGLAYRTYYTHEVVPQPQPTNGLQRLRAALGNGYRNARYGTHFSPALYLGNLLGHVIRPLAWQVDIAYRFLPRGRGRVLDVGSGSGAWLEMASDAGWTVAGVDPDPIARQRAAAAGFDVRPRIEDWLQEPGSFDAITLNHVLEHLHHPIQVLQAAHVLLRPGGQLYIDTPNIDARGHEVYGRNWRGLEPPRHLIIFNKSSLFDALHKAGFTRVKKRNRIYPYAWLASQSERISLGLNPADTLTHAEVHPSRRKHIRAQFEQGQVEFLTVTAEKFGE